MNTMHTAIKTIDYHDTWPIRHRVMWPDKPEDYVRLDDDPKGTHPGSLPVWSCLALGCLLIHGLHPYPEPP